ncbi:hypothetical protein QCA50_007365 [Cerrena zonata]|uniref:Uncharacterized protein n=1 Tax=Cerrena zonata TaxID=2478898 RepID=A0AAW0G7E7_9APHY
MTVGRSYSMLLLVATTAVWTRHLERRIVFPLDSITFQAIQVSLQIFTVVIQTALVYTTQQLSLRRNLCRQQYLTVTHDTAAAWNGFGAALMALFAQRTTSVSVRPLSPIIIYLGCLVVLHITIPTVFSTTTVPALSPRNIRTTLALPEYTASAYQAINANSIRALPGLPAMSLLRQGLNTVGWEGNTVYDIIDDDPSGTGTVLVNSTRFEVSCGTLPTLWLNTSDYNDASQRTLSGNASFTLSDGEYEWDILYVPWSSDVIRVPNVRDWIHYNGLLSSANHGNSFLVYSTRNFTDSDGSAGTSFWMGDIWPGYLKTTMQWMGCNISRTNGYSEVNAGTKTLVTSPPVKTASKWTEWRPADNPDDPWLMSWQELYSGIRDDRPFIATMRDTQCQMPLSYSDCELTTIESFLMDSIGMSLNNQKGPDASMLQLHVLEEALANLTAAIVWTSRAITTSDSFWPTRSVFGESIIQSRMQDMAQLELNSRQVIISLVGSIVLLICAIILVGGPRATDGAPESAGILQVLWMVRSRGDILEQLLNVSEPDNALLRRHGLVYVRMAGKGEDRDGGPEREGFARGLHWKNERDGRDSSELTLSQP